MSPMGESVKIGMGKDSCSTIETELETLYQVSQILSRSLKNYQQLKK